MKRGLFSLSNTRLFSCDMGELVPIGLTEVLPGDTLQQATSMLVRASPLLAPVMHPVDVRIHHWYVPFRLIWDSWENFITGGPDGLNASVFPTITIGGGSGAAVGSLADYLGVPTGVNNIAVSALPFRAYNLIWNNWYRDQDLQTPLVVSKADGADTTTAGPGGTAYTSGAATLSNVCWEKDYFTSARPWEQKGPTVTVPLGTRADVKGIATDNAVNFNAGTSGALRQTPAGPTTTFSPYYQSAGGSIVIKGGAGGAAAYPDIYADLSTASAVTVNALRQALALQRYEEARARFGSRYVEYLRYLGVKSSDGRLNLPEYCGGGS